MKRLAIILFSLLILSSCNINVKEKNPSTTPATPTIPSFDPDNIALRNNSASVSSTKSGSFIRKDGTGGIIGDFRQSKYRYDSSNGSGYKYNSTETGYYLSNTVTRIFSYDGTCQYIEYDNKKNKLNFSKTGTFTLKAGEDDYSSASTFDYVEIKYSDGTTARYKYYVNYTTLELVTD